MATTTATTLRLTTPASQMVFTISDAPAMPTLRVDAVLTPAPAAASALRFEWKLRVVFSGGETPHGRPGAALEVSKITTTGTLNVTPGDWSRIRGGHLTISASVMVLGKTLTAALTGLRIVGTNPSESAIRQLLGSDPLQRIARQESRMRQFGPDGWPLFSRATTWAEPVSGRSRHRARTNDGTGARMPMR